MDNNTSKNKQTNLWGLQQEQRKYSVTPVSQGTVSVQCDTLRENGKIKIM